MLKSKSLLLTTNSSRPENRPLISVGFVNGALTYSMPFRVSIAVSTMLPPTDGRSTSVRSAKSIVWAIATPLYGMIGSTMCDGIRDVL
jgi:hypothetical protein